MAKSLFIVVSGRVQGVAFRYYTREMARSLGVRGWVRNLPDGRVEALAQGDEAALARFVEALGQGPPMAAVAKVDTSWTEDPERFPDFTVRR